MTSHPIPPLSPDMAGSARKPSKWEQNAAAFLSLAITQRRLAIRYRKLAANADSIDDFRRYRNEAARLWREAHEHVSFARHHREMHERMRHD